MDTKNFMKKQTLRRRRFCRLWTPFLFCWIPLAATAHPMHSTGGFIESLAHAFSSGETLFAILVLAVLFFGSRRQTSRLD